MATISRHLHASKEEVFALLSDYTRYADWTADVVEATVLAAEGDIVVAEFFSPELLKTSYQLEFLHSEATSISYKQVGQGRNRRGLEGSWHLADAPDRNGSIVTGVMNLRTHLFNSLSNRRRAGLVLRRRLDVLQAMFSDRTGEDDSESGREGKRKVVWFGGRKYLVEKVG